MNYDFPAQSVIRAVEAHLPGRKVQAIIDRGDWVRRIFEVTLDGRQTVYLKVEMHPEWLSTVGHEEIAAQKLDSVGIPAARLLAIDKSNTLLPRPFVIQEHRAGQRLGELLERKDEAVLESIYEKLGDVYRRMHSLHHESSGLWGESAEEVWGEPTGYMFKAEVIEGSGQKLLEAGRISRKTYDLIVSIWTENLDYLRDHVPTLVHGSPFLWTIYMEEDEAGWQLAKLTSMGDMLWWDAAYDLAFLKYPPFGSHVPRRWKAFERAYGTVPDTKRVLLYLLMQRLCAANGIYMEPASPQTKTWSESCLEDLDVIVEQIKNGSQ